MFKENQEGELIGYITKLDSSEKAGLLKQLKKREAYLKAAQLDAKGKKMKKTGKLSMNEIAEIVRGIRRNNAKKAA